MDWLNKQCHICEYPKAMFNFIQFSFCLKVGTFHPQTRNMGFSFGCESPPQTCILLASWFVYNAQTMLQTGKRLCGTICTTKPYEKQK